MVVDMTAMHDVVMLMRTLLSDCEKVFAFTKHGHSSTIIKRHLAATHRRYLVDGASKHKSGVVMHNVGSDNDSILRAT